MNPAVAQRLGHEVGVVLLAHLGDLVQVSAILAEGTEAAVALKKVHGEEMKQNDKTSLNFFILLPLCEYLRQCKG